jgi:hypothetical protein
MHASFLCTALPLLPEAMEGTEWADNPNNYTHPLLVTAAINSVRDFPQGGMGTQPENLLNIITFKLNFANPDPSH